LKTLYEMMYAPNAAKWSRKSPFQSAVLLLALLLLLSGCGLFAASDEQSDAPASIRTIHPTFTPTAEATPAPAPQNELAASQEQATPMPDASQATGAKAVINGPLVNARSGPGTEFEIVGVNPAGDWWQICCIDEAAAWVTSEFVDTIGLVDSVPVIGGAAEVDTTSQTDVAEAQPTQPPAVTAAPPTATAPPSASFTLETQEQFPETSVVRIFLYVYSGNSALEGYSLRVTKDGTELPVDGTSFGGQPAFTWPFQDPRQRFQNFKMEYSDTPAPGVWQVQLIDSTGAMVGPPATFTLNANDPNQELYVRYAQN
jgi:hypothetical protein